MKADATKAFLRLLDIMDDLRAKCPWDKKQTLESLRYLSIEEVYELSDAILEKDHEAIKGELGDLFLHLVFYSKIESEKGNFDVTEVLNTVCEKLIRRHPHIYGNINAEDEEAVRKNWEQLKLEEKKSKGEKERTLSGVPASLPALVKAQRIQEKARGVGFDWQHPAPVWAKVQEEVNELREHIDENHQLRNPEAAEEEFGDLLFALVNYARFIGINPENALEKTNKKFIKRFEYIEDQAQKNNTSLPEMQLEEMELLWQKAKGL